MEASSVVVIRLCKMNEQEYITGRVDNQIDWYSSKSQWNQKWFKRLRILEIVCAALIPLLVSYIGENSLNLKIVVGLFGAMIAVISSILGIYKFEENWIQYRTTSESLKHEKFLFLTRSSQYAIENPFSMFVQRIESLISKENSGWAQYINKNAEPSTPIQ
jgi:hypothetical protein